MNDLLSIKGDDNNNYNITPITTFSYDKEMFLIYSIENNENCKIYVAQEIIENGQYHLVPILNKNKFNIIHNIANAIISGGSHGK